MGLALPAADNGGLIYAMITVMYINMYVHLAKTSGLLFAVAERGYCWRPAGPRERFPMNGVSGFLLRIATGGMRDLQAQVCAHRPAGQLVCKQGRGGGEKRSGRGFLVGTLVDAYENEAGTNIC
jgi:hypothetical protein